jgi:hypothetical protein
MRQDLREMILMNNKILGISAILLLTFVSLSTFIPFSLAAGEGQWITGYRIEDANGRLLVEFDAATGVNRTLSPVIPGSEVKITFSVNIFASGANSLKLTTGLAKSTNHPSGYWELLSEDYDMGSSYNPAAASTTFKWTVGTFNMILYGIVPSTQTGTARTINAVTLSSGDGGTIIDHISVQVTSSDLANFNTLYNEQEQKLQSLKNNGISQGYIQLYTNVLQASRNIANEGNVAGAMELLRGLNVPNEPVSSTMEALFLPIVGATAAIAVIFVVLFMRNRGKLSYFQLVVEDQIKDLEGLTLMASKIDKPMSASLDSVKDRLKRLVGGT